MASARPRGKAGAASLLDGLPILMTDEGLGVRSGKAQIEHNRKSSLG
jgi:hypothetical protein